MLTDGKTAGSDGAYRNITEGGMQETSGFTERADGLLLYVPGFGTEGILIGLTGGVNETFVSLIFLLSALELTNTDANERDRCI
jgi:hypothetical protein